MNRVNPQSYSLTRRTLGRLSSLVVHPTDPSVPIRSLAVFCHGFGASGDDLVGLGSELLHSATLEAATMMVFPAAPIELDAQGIPGGRAWWLLSIQRLVSAMELGRYEQIREEVPEGIDSAREHLVEAVEAAMELSGVDESRLMLGGFSQGAMLTVDTALRGLREPPAAACLYSGCLICERQWRPLAGRLRTTAILQSHGRMDPILPFQTGLWLRDMLVESGCTVDFVEFGGMHTIPSEAIERTAVRLAALTNAPGELPGR